MQIRELINAMEIESEGRMYYTKTRTTSGGSMMRTIDVSEITKNVKEMCIEANHYLSKDMDEAMKRQPIQKKLHLESRF